MITSIYLKGVLFLSLIGALSCNNLKHGYSVPLASYDTKDSIKGSSSAGFMVYDATRRGSFYYIDYKTKKLKIVSEPPPDAVVSLTREISGNANVLDKVILEAKYKAVENIAELGKRTAGVNMLRDALYKLAEIRMSNDSIDAVTAGLFKEALNVAKEIAIVELEAQRTEQAKHIASMNKDQLQTFNNKSTAKEEFNSIVKELLSLDFTQNKLSLKDSSIIIKAFSDFKKFDDSHPQYYNAFELHNLLKAEYNKGVHNVLTKDILNLFEVNNRYYTEEVNEIIKKIKNPKK